MSKYIDLLRKAEKAETHAERLAAKSERMMAKGDYAAAERLLAQAEQEAALARNMYAQLSSSSDEDDADENCLEVLKKYTRRELSAFRPHFSKVYRTEINCPFCVHKVFDRKVHFDDHLVKEHIDWARVMECAMGCEQETRRASNKHGAKEMRAGRRALIYTNVQIPAIIVHL